MTSSPGLGCPGERVMVSDRSASGRLPTSTEVLLAGTGSVLPAAATLAMPCGVPVVGGLSGTVMTTLIGGAEPGCSIAATQRASVPACTQVHGEAPEAGVLMMLPCGTENVTTAPATLPGPLFTTCAV